MGYIALYWGVMLIGYFAGSKLRNYQEKMGFINGVMLICISLLVLLMGVRMGSNEEVIHNLGTIGVESFITVSYTHLDVYKRQIKNYETVIDDSNVEIPDYKAMDKVLIECFLLDPEQCAACTYMLASVEDNWDDLKDMAEYRVYKYFIKDDIARTRKMGIANLPTMCIDGEQKYISIIPSKEELIEAVKEAKAKK